MKPPPNFDNLAGAYLWLERLTFGNLLWKCRCAYLDELRSCRTALVIGDGDGRFTARLLESNPDIRIDAVDNSPAMLRALLQRAGTNSTRVHIHQADARTFAPPQHGYDLIVTHFFLDCLTTEEVIGLANRLRSCVAPSCRWVISEFAIAKGWLGWIFARPLVGALYITFWLLTRTTVFCLPDHREALPLAGFALTHRYHILGGSLVSEMWQPL
jgi:SAM-dependent methyltransferase